MAFPTRPLARRSRALLLATAVAVLLASCSDADPGTDATTPAAQPQASPEAPEEASAGATVGGDGSAIELSPLTAEDIEAAALSGELACSFSMDGAASLLVARGNVDSDEPSRGVVKVGSYVEPVSALGGFDAMLEGARFSGAGKTVSIALTGPATGGGESPARPATLAYDRADGARREFAGQWQCGP